MRTDLESLQRLAKQGWAIYDSEIKPRLTAEDDGRLVLIEIGSHDFEIAWEEHAHEAYERLYARHKSPEIYRIRVGSQVVSHMGGVGTRP